MKEILSKLNKVLENRTRLGIMSALVVSKSVDYNRLKELLGVTDGNLASHLKTLQKNGMIIVSKRFIESKPNTSYSVTDEGRKIFTGHLEAMEYIMKQL